MGALLGSTAESTATESAAAARSSRRVWVVWSVALLAYLVGVMHRTSFGVAGLDAAQRFGATPAALSGFVVLQLLVYAALQVPVGLLLDRFGGRLLITVGALVWAAVLLVTPPAPHWLLAALMVVIGTGGPGSMLGFDFARTFNPASRRGGAVGIVNVGGFVSSLLVAWAMGVVLGRAGGYTPEAFRLAWTVQYAVWVFALAAILVARRRARRKLAAEGTPVPPLREALAARRRRRRVR